MIPKMERIRTILCHPDYRRITARIDELERERIYCRHGLPHLLDTARIASLLAEDRHADIPRDVIYAAALLHDIGRLAQYTEGKPHAAAGVQAAKEILRDTAFTAREQTEILNAIGKHQHGDRSESLAQLIYEADEASRMCFACSARDTCYWSEERKNDTVLL